MEEEYKAEALIPDRGKTDLFGLLKSKLLHLENKKRNSDNAKLTLLLTFPYIRITTELEAMLKKHRVKRLQQAYLDERLGKRNKTLKPRENRKLLPKKNKQEYNK